MQEKILNDIRYRNVFKRTYQNRFDEFDNICIDAMKHFIISSNKVLVHDLAVSDGRTSYDFYKLLIKQSPGEIIYFASDILPYVFEISTVGSRVKTIIDKGQNVIQVIFPPFVFNEFSQDNKLYFINLMLKYVIDRTVVKAQLRDVRNNEAKLVIKKIYLVDKKCRDLMSVDHNFSFESYDIFDRATRQVNIVRAMNILNPTYFPQSDIKIILRNIHDSLLVDGYLIVGSNGDKGSCVDGGIYQKMNTGFISLRHAAVPSRINQVIIDFDRTEL
ncbi:MAG: hypothetical protein HQL30_05445 [Candidatus Omnitrophica bacterium]|nr:hypothetical protein [Candidatus Omnitrophota bacterium]